MGKKLTHDLLITSLATLSRLALPGSPKGEAAKDRASAWVSFSTAARGCFQGSRAPFLEVSAQLEGSQMLEVEVHTLI